MTLAPMGAFEDWLRGIARALQWRAYRSRVNELLDPRIFLGPF
jgi:hypothetical protein